MLYGTEHISLGDPIGNALVVYKRIIGIPNPFMAATFGTVGFKYGLDILLKAEGYAVITGIPYRISRLGLIRRSGFIRSATPEACGIRYHHS